MSQIPNTPIKFIIYCLKPLKYRVLLSYILVGIAAALSISKTYVIKIVTDTIVAFNEGKVQSSDVWVTMIGLCLLAFFSALAWRCTGYATMGWVTKGIQIIHKTLFEYLSRHSIDYFQNRFAGAIVNKISNVTKGFDKFVTQMLWQYYSNFLILIFSFALLFGASSILGLCILFTNLLAIYVTFLSSKKLITKFYNHAEANSKLKGRLVDSASNIVSVQSAPAIEYEHQYVGNYINKERDTHLLAWRGIEKTLLYSNFLFILTFIINVTLATDLYLNNKISLGDVIMLITILISLERMIFVFATELTNTMSAYGEMKEGLNEILIPYQVFDSKQAMHLVVNSGQVEVKNICFSYGSLSVYKDFNLTISPGQKVGLVGRSGGGKTTFISLLLRHFDLQSGSIEIDQQNIAQVTLESLRKNLSYVPQSTELFHRSIYDNILYGRLDATKEEVLTASRLAMVDEFVKNLPNGYETFVGERGVKLSGGQRQRIAIARAILKNSKILLLDEATSALDSESELAVQVGLEELMKNKTTIAIAHRLSTLRKMDRLIVIDKGTIVEDGSHQELLEKNGLYASLWNSQVGGFIG